MPYTEKQNKLFRAAAHDKDISKSSGMPMSVAKKLAAEGVAGMQKNKLAKMMKHA